EADVTLPGQPARQMVFTNSRAAGLLKLDFPEIQDAARLSVTRSEIRVGETASTSAMVWADADFFKVMAYPALAGDPATALRAPDGLVLTHEAARRLFGADAPIGRILMVNPAMDFVQGLPDGEARMMSSFHPMRVLAVLKDMPANTHLNGEIF